MGFGAILMKLRKKARQDSVTDGSKYVRIIRFMKKKEPNKHLSKGLLVGGVIVIVAIAGLITYYLYQNNVEEQVFTNNYTTSVLFYDSLATSSGAAPWALLSLNWFVCRAMIQRWMAFIRARFQS